MFVLEAVLFIMDVDSELTPAVAVDDLDAAEVIGGAQVSD